MLRGASGKSLTFRENETKRADDLRNKIFEQVREFCYLGFSFSYGRDSDVNIKLNTFQ
jgi:hypothetical protein